MQLGDILTADLSLITNTNFKCACGKTCGSIPTKIYAGGAAIGNLSLAVGGIIAPGMGAVLIADDVQLAGIADSMLRRGGFRVMRLSGQQAQQNLQAVADGIGVVVAIGGNKIIDIAKRFSHNNNLPLVLVHISCNTVYALSPLAEICGGGLYKLKQFCAPKVVICDYDLLQNSMASCASAFGEIVSKMLAVLDVRFSGIIGGKSNCSCIAEQCHNICDSVIRALNGTSRGEMQRASILADCGLRLSALSVVAENQSFLCGADVNLAHALKMLFLAEERQQKQSGENRFLLANIAAKVYHQILSGGSCGFSFSPDNNLRAERLTEYFNVKQSVAARAVYPITGGEKLRLNMYKMREYRNELYDLIVDICALYTQAFKVFKRMYADDGYSLVKYIDSADVKLCLALAPDLGCDYTFLTHIKDMGLLDEYI